MTPSWASVLRDTARSCDTDDPIKKMNHHPLIKLSLLYFTDTYNLMITHCSLVAHQLILYTAVLDLSLFKNTLNYVFSHCHFVREEYNNCTTLNMDKTKENKGRRLGRWGKKDFWSQVKDNMTISKQFYVPVTRVSNISKKVKVCWIEANLPGCVRRGKLTPNWTER